MKSYQLAAAVLTALAATSAQADTVVNDIVIYEAKQKTMCIPVGVWDGKAEIYSLCDASEVNKKFNLKLNEKGCAVSGQSLYKDNGEVMEQVAYNVWAETEEELNKQVLPMCDEFEAAEMLVEL